MILLQKLSIADKEEIFSIKKEIHQFIGWNLNLFGKDFYIEIQPTLSDYEKKINRLAITIASAYNIKVIITTDAHYQDKSRARVHEAYLKSKEGDRELSDFYATTYIMAVEELWDYFKDYITINEFKEFCYNSIEISNKVEEYTLFQDTIVPEIPITGFKLNHIFKPYYEQYEAIRKFGSSLWEQDAWLLKMIEKGFEEKGEKFDEVNLRRINTELETLWIVSEKLKQRLSSYYNLLDYMVDLMLDEKRGNSFVGVARGSVTGFYIAYLIDIIQMNPIKWGLYEWRHLSPTRPELPKQKIGHTR
jgi:DNA polymerase-3 subunit alpha